MKGVRKLGGKQLGFVGKGEIRRSTALALHHPVECSTKRHERFVLRATELNALSVIDLPTCTHVYFLHNYVS